MVNWKRLGLSVLCTAILLGGLEVLALLPLKVLLTLIVVGLVFSFYRALGDNRRIKIKLEGGMMPKKATPFDAAYDVYVPEDTDVTVGRQCIDLKFRMELPHGMAAFIRSRSGYSLKGIEATVVDMDDEERDVRIDAEVITGLVDEKFRGCLGVLFYYHYYDGYYKRVYLKKGTRIAQMQIVSIPETKMVEADELDMTNDRGGGFGHTNM